MAEVSAEYEERQRAVAAGSGEEVDFRSHPFSGFEISAPAGSPSSLRKLYSAVVSVIGEDRATAQAELLSELFALGVTEGLSFKRQERLEAFVRSTVPELIGLAERFGESKLLMVLKATARHAAEFNGFTRFCRLELPAVLESCESDGELHAVCSLLERGALRVMRRAESGCFSRQETWSAGEFYFDYVVPRTLAAFKRDGACAADQALQQAVDQILTTHDARAARRETLAAAAARGMQRPEAGAGAEEAFQQLKIREEWLVNAGIPKKDRRDYLFLYEVLQEAELAGLSRENGSRERFCRKALKPLLAAKAALGHAAALDLLSSIRPFSAGGRHLIRFCEQGISQVVESTGRANFITTSERDDHIEDLSGTIRSLARAGLPLETTLRMLGWVQQVLLLRGREPVEAAIAQAAAGCRAPQRWRLADEFGSRLQALESGDLAACVLLENEELRVAVYRAGLGRKYLQSLVFDQTSGVRRAAEAFGPDFAASVLREALNAGIYQDSFRRMAGAPLARLVQSTSGAEGEVILDLLRQTVPAALPLRRGGKECEAAPYFEKLLASVIPALAAPAGDNFARQFYKTYLEALPGIRENAGYHETADGLILVAGDVLPLITALTTDSDPAKLAGRFAELALAADGRGFKTGIACLARLIENREFASTSEVETFLGTLLVPLFATAPSEIAVDVRDAFRAAQSAGLMSTRFDAEGVIAALRNGSAENPQALRGVLLPALEHQRISAASGCAQWFSSAAILSTVAADQKTLLFGFGTPMLIASGIARNPAELEQAGRELLAVRIKEAPFWETVARISEGAELRDPDSVKRIPVQLRPALARLLGHDAAALNLAWPRIGKSRDALRIFVDFLDCRSPSAREILFRLNGRRGPVVLSILDYHARLARAGRSFYYPFRDPVEFNAKQRAAYTEYATRLCSATALSPANREKLERISAPSARRLLTIYAGLSSSIGRGPAQMVLGGLMDDYVSGRCRTSRYDSKTAQEQLAHLSIPQKREWAANRIRCIHLETGPDSDRAERLLVAFDALRGKLPAIYERHLYSFVPRIPFDHQLRSGEKLPLSLRNKLRLRAARLIEGPVSRMIREDGGRGFGALRDLRSVLRLLGEREALACLSELELQYRDCNQAQDALLYAVETDSLPELLDTQNPSNNCILWERQTPGTKAIPSFAADPFMKKVLLIAPQCYGIINDDEMPGLIERVARRAIADDRVSITAVRRTGDGTWSFRIEGDLTADDSASRWHAHLALDSKRLYLLREGDEVPRAVLELKPKGSEYELWGPGSQVLVWQNLAVLPTQCGPFIFPDSYDPRAHQLAAQLANFIVWKGRAAGIPVYEGGRVMEVSIPPSRAPYVFHQRLFHGALPAEERGPHHVGYAPG